MVGLGVLRRTKVGGYALRSPNVVTLIGSREQIYRELDRSEDLEIPSHYDPETFRPAYRKEGEVDRARRSPLTAAQESELLRRRHGVSIVFGTDAAGLHDVGKFLRSAVDGSFFIPLDATGDRRSVALKFGDLRLRDRDQSGTTVVYVGPDVAWRTEAVEEALDRVNRLTSSISFVRVIFMAGPAVTWSLLREVDQDQRTELDRLISAGVSVTGIRPWADAALRHWLEETEFGASSREVRRQIASVTGNWPILLNRLHQSVSEGGRHWQAALDEIDRSLNDSAQAGEVTRSLGLDIPEPRAVLLNLSILGEATMETIEQNAAGSGSQRIIAPTLRWAELLGLAKPMGGGNWGADRLVARLLIGSEE
jgi:hypothetical protein